jgi:hypothetical protein
MTGELSGRFASRWVDQIAKRWARNGGVLAAMLALGRLGGSREMNDLFASGIVRTILTFAVFAVVAILFAGTGWVLGVWARWSLRALPDATATLRRITRNWIIGLLVIAGMVLIADVVLEWRGPSPLAIGTSLDAALENLVYLASFFGSAALVGWVTAVVSRRGLKQAIADDDATA